ncbi:MAG: GatB/YqeY domain-containing protein [Nitrospira sp.]
MSLSDRLTEDLKLAMKSRDQLRMDVIRMIKAAVLNKEVELKRDLDDAEMSRVMTTLVKQRRESVEQFEKLYGWNWLPKNGRKSKLSSPTSPTALGPLSLRPLSNRLSRRLDPVPSKIWGSP